MTNIKKKTFITNMKARRYPPLSIYHKEMTEKKYKLVKRRELLEFSGIYSFEWYGSQRRRKESIHGRHWRNSSKTMKEFMKDIWRAISQLETQSCPPWQKEKKFQRHRINGILVPASPYMNATENLWPIMKEMHMRIENNIQERISWKRYRLLQVTGNSK